MSTELIVVALQKMIDEGDIWFNVTKDGNLSITFHSFDMPEKDGEPSDIWHKEFTLLDRAIKWAGDYDLENISATQKKDLEARADAFDRLATEFRKAAGLPSNAEVTGA